MKTYRITNRRTRETQIVQAPSFQEACEFCGWMPGWCSVQEVKEPLALIANQEPAIADLLRELR